MPKGKPKAKKKAAAKEKKNVKKKSAAKKKVSPKTNPRKILPKSKFSSPKQIPETPKKKVHKITKKSPVKTIASSPIVQKKKVAAKKKTPSRSPIAKKAELPVVLRSPPKKKPAALQVKSPPRREKKCTLPTTTKLEQTILSILGSEGSIRFNLGYQYEIGDKSHLYSSIISKRFASRKGQTIVIVETISIVSKPTTYEMDTKVVASTAYEPNISIIIDQGTFPYLEYSTLRSELLKRIKESLYTDYYLSLSTLGCTSQQSISEKTKEILENLIRTVIPNSKLKSALSILRGGSGNPADIDRDTYNALLRLSSAFLLKDNISYLDNDENPSIREIRILRNNFNALLGKSIEDIPNSSPAPSQPQEVLPVSLTCTDAPTQQECLSVLSYWISILSRGRSIRTWVRTQTSKKGYHEKNIIISATNKGYKLTITSTIVPYDTNIIEEQFSEIEDALSVDGVITELSSVYKKFLYIDFYLYISVITTRSLDCITNELAKRYIRTVLGNTGLSIRTIAFLIDEQEIPPAYTGEIHSIAYRLYGSLIGNSERYSITDTSDWERTKEERANVLISLYQQLISYQP